MTKVELITGVLKNHSCLTAREISFFARKEFQEDITPNSVSGQLRTLVAQGKAANSKNINGQTVYWLMEEVLV